MVPPFARKTAGAPAGVFLALCAITVGLACPSTPGIPNNLIHPALLTVGAPNARGESDRLYVGQPYQASIRAFSFPSQIIYGWSIPLDVVLTGLAWAPTAAAGAGEVYAVTATGGGTIGIGSLWRLVPDPTPVVETRTLSSLGVAGAPISVGVLPAAATDPCAAPWVVVGTVEPSALWALRSPWAPLPCTGGAAGLPLEEPPSSVVAATDGVWVAFAGGDPVAGYLFDRIGAAWSPLGTIPGTSGARIVAFNASATPAVAIDPAGIVVTFFDRSTLGVVASRSYDPKFSSLGGGVVRGAAVLPFPTTAAVFFTMSASTSHLLTGPYLPGNLNLLVPGGDPELRQTATDNLQSSVPLAEGVALSPDGSRIYVANSGSNSIGVVNRAQFYQPAYDLH